VKCMIEAERVSETLSGETYVAERINKKEPKKWDTYTGENTLIIKDYNIKWWNETWLKECANRHELRLPLKLKGVWGYAAWTTVIITCDKPVDHIHFESQANIKNRYKTEWHITNDGFIKTRGGTILTEAERNDIVAGSLWITA